MSGPAAPFEPSPGRAILLKVVSVAAFVAMQTMIKFAGQLPSGQIIFFRSFFAMLPVLVMLAWQRELRTAFHTSRPGGHIFRGFVGVCGMGFGFFALTRLPLPEAIVLNYAQPLLVVLISAVVLHETVRVYRWTAVAIGLVGVLVIAWPQLTLLEEGIRSQQGLGALAALAAAAVSAVAMLQVRSLVATEKSSTIVLWFSATATIVALCTIPWGWTSLSVTQMAFLGAAGLLGGIGQILMTESYRHASAATVAPFEYTSMLFGIVVGYLAFSDIPTIYTIVGGAIVVASGLFIIWREHWLGLDRGKARKVAPPQ